AIRDVLVLVANRKTAPVAVDDLYAATEVKREVELRGVDVWHLIAEIEKPAGGLSEGLHSPVSPEVEFQTNRRDAPTVEGFPVHSENRGRRRSDKSLVRY